MWVWRPWTSTLFAQSERLKKRRKGMNLKMRGKAEKLRYQEKNIFFKGEQIPEVKQRETEAERQRRKTRHRAS